VFDDKRMIGKVEVELDRILNLEDWTQFKEEIIDEGK
jgi:hypothetical protein